MLAIELQKLAPPIFFAHHFDQKVINWTFHSLKLSVRSVIGRFDSPADMQGNEKFVKYQGMNGIAILRQSQL